jgi:hypothetical protein
MFLEKYSDLSTILEKDDYDRFYKEYEARIKIEKRLKVKVVAIGTDIIY